MKEMRMNNWLQVALAVLWFPTLGLSTAFGLDLDWSGQFRVENHWLYNYTMDSGNQTPDAQRLGANGYYIPGGGSNNARFQSLFMRLRPVVVVNDNVYLKSEWWVGDPVFGMFGDSVPYNRGRRTYKSVFSRGSPITAQRYWAEFLSDIGTIQVGRVPLDYGLGLVWNDGNDVWSRHPSTGDAARLVAKFGAFTIAPSFVKYSEGNNIGGRCTVGGGGTCTVGSGNGDVSEYSLLFKYDNDEEQLELGLNFIRRLGAANQTTLVGPGAPGGGGSALGIRYNVWDIYGKKGFGDFDLGLEVPIVDGTLGSMRYQTIGAAFEADWDISENWDTQLKLGRAPGQPGTDQQLPDDYQAFYFHPNYQLGLIMFNYQLANFAGSNTLNDARTGQSTRVSPFDNPVVNANYLSWTGGYRLGRWRFSTTWTAANAVETAGSGSDRFFNTWQRQFFDFNGGASDQKAFMGWEMDYGVQFFWDDAFEFRFDFGWFFPGDYYKFSNTGTENSTDSVIAVHFGAGVRF